MNHIPFRIDNIFAPKSLNETTVLLERYGDKARLVAAGTDLILRPDTKTRYLVDMSRIGLNYVKTDGRFLILGCMSTITDILTSTLFDQQPNTMMKTAALLFGCRQIRNRATIGGNICSAVPSADMPIPLIALDAKVEIVGTEGKRTTHLGDFIKDYRQTDLRKGEFLKEVQIPLSETKSKGAFRKLSRTAVDIALVSCAVRLDLENFEFRIVLGAVGPTPIRARKAEDFLKQQREINEAEIAKGARLASEEAKPITDLRASAEYRKAMSEVLVSRALREVLES